MQKSKVLASIKNLLPPIHQPLPLTERRSQHLLDAINTSFRRQLDEEHGFTSDTANTASSHRPTDRHLHAILNNPLFTQANATPTNAAKQLEGSANTCDAQKLIFEKAVARGLMTEAIALGFLRQIRTSVQESAALSLADGLKATGAGRLVLQWLRSAGLERSLSFVSNQAFTRALLLFMIAEGLEDLVWVWIERLMQVDRQPGEPAAAISPPLEQLLRSLVLAKASVRLDLNDAYASFLKAARMNKDNSLPRNNLQPAWMAVAQKTTIESWQFKKPSADLFDRFDAMFRDTSRVLVVMARAHLYIYHPIKPSSTLALRHLEDESTWENTRPAVRNAPVPPYIRMLAALGLDTVQHLIQTDQVPEATNIMEKLRKHLIFNDGSSLIGPRLGTWNFNVA